VVLGDAYLLSEARARQFRCPLSSEKEPKRRPLSRSGRCGDLVSDALHRTAIDRNRRILLIKNRKLRILCFHGYRGTHNLRNANAAVGAGIGGAREVRVRDAPSWKQALRLVASRSRTLRRFSKLPASTTLRRGRRMAEDERLVDFAISISAPFDGVFGSARELQLASLLVGLRSHRVSGQPHLGRFPIGSAALPARPHHANLYSRNRNNRSPLSVNVIGASDFVVPSRRSDHLASLFRNPLKPAANSGALQSRHRNCEAPSMLSCNEGRVMPRLALTGGNACRSGMMRLGVV